MSRPSLTRLQPGVYRTRDGQYTLTRVKVPGPRGGHRHVWTIDGEEPVPFPTLEAAVLSLLPQLRGWREYGNTSGTVYLLHLERPFGHARHYLGWTKSESALERLEQHRAGTGANMLRHANLAGIRYDLVRVWPGGRDLERRLKKSGSGCRHCPRCLPETRTRRAETQRERYHRDRLSALLPSTAGAPAPRPL